MAQKSLNERVTQLEAELTAIKQRLPSEPANWRGLIGIFADDPAFEEAMQLGREYRESQHPRTPLARKHANVRPRH